ncbi:ATP-binding protein [Streptomyces sp. NPDC005407]|uniref:sensor histidine kinase n=1 Tax=Streptomyces sp. NPDC005407 TaxID=3155340 RepID=UPI00339FB983
MNARTFPGGTAAEVWEAAIGPGFTEALRKGLSRVAPPWQSTAATAPAPPGGSPGPRIAGRLAPLEPAVPTVEGAHSLLDAVLHRFEAALPDALEPADRFHPAVLRTVVAGARLVLAAAFGTDREDYADGPGNTPPAVPSPHPSAAVSALLMECAVLELLENDALDAVSVRALGRALRQADSATAATVKDTACCWREQRRIARELHNEVAGALTASLELLEPPGGTVAAPAAAAQWLREADARLRELITGLREQSAVPPLGEAVRSFAATAAPAGTALTVRLTGDEQLVPDAQRRELFLTLREALRNSFTHAGARNVKVSVRATRWWVYASVSDDGYGFDAGRELRPGHSHQGFRSMAERMEDIGGRLTVRSAPLAGTQVEMHLPLRPRATVVSA